MVIQARVDEEQAACGGIWSTMDVGTKINRVCYAGGLSKNVDCYLSGTWDELTNKLILWNVYYGKAKVSPESYYKKSDEIVTSSSINSIFRRGQKIVVGLEDGNIEVCMNDRGERLQRLHSFHNVHGNFRSSTSVCMLNEDIISGSDNGSIMRLDLATTYKISTLSTNLNSVKCMAVCGLHEFVSGHGSGQIHLWDFRTLKSAMTIGNMPTFSKAVSPLTDAITSLASHPAQPNVIGYGTYSGSTAFIDVRYYKEPTPNLLKVSQEPITNIKFHPNFPTNCFILSGENLLQMDLSMGAKSTRREPGEPIDDLAGKSKANVWLTAASWNLLDINSLLADGPKQLSSFDLSSHSILCGSNTNCLSLLAGAHFY